MNKKYSLFPIDHMNLWTMYKKHVASFWTTEEIDFSKDQADWQRLQPQERDFLKMILAFFAVSDSVVMQNLVENFVQDVDVTEAKVFYAFQAAMENIHAETYALMIDTYVRDTADKDRLYNAVQNFKSIQQKTSWAERWMDKTIPFPVRLVAFSCVEGIFFSAAFCSIFWVRKRGMMPGLTFSNELIARDEGLHTDFAVLFFREHYEKEGTVTKKLITQIVQEAVEVERAFVRDALPERLLGMNSDSMITYVKFCADRLLVEYGCDKLYDVKNPFEFMEMISLQGKANFFEKRVGDYQKSNVMHTLEKKEAFKFSTTVDF